MQELLLRRIDLHLAGANWQRGGGKGSKPKAIELPSDKPRKSSKLSGADVAQRLRNLGLIPAGNATNPPPPTPTADELAKQADTMWVQRHERLASE